MVENLAYSHVKQFFRVKHPKQNLFGCNFTMDKAFSCVQSKKHPYLEMIDPIGKTKVIIHIY
jgi:hypothetical protein